MFDLGDIGGQILHDHDFTSDSHFHFFSFGTDVEAGLSFDGVVTFEDLTGTTETSPNLPPYHSLLPIMYDGRRL